MPPVISACLFLITLALVVDTAECQRIIQVPSFTYPDLQVAISSAQNGDHIQILGGVYNHSFCGAIIDNGISNLTISGASDGNQQTILDCAGGNQRAITLFSTNAAISMTISFLTFRNGLATDSGGALAFYVNAQPAAISIANCTFINNTALNGGGGALFISFSGAVISGASVSIVGGIFDQNIGGGVKMLFNNQTTACNVMTNQVTFTNNRATFGGGIQLLFLDSVSNSNIELKDSTFSSNVAHYGGGGGIVRFEAQATNCNISLLSGNYLYNRAENAGGGALVIWIEGQGMGCKVAIFNGTYISNKGQYGGGALVVNFSSYAYNCSVVVTKGRFLSNSAPAGGGGGILAQFLQTTANSNVIVMGGSYVNNWAPGYSGGGGGVLIAAKGYAFNHNVSVSNAIFINNTAAYGGGVVVGYDNDASNCTVQITDGFYQGNTAQYSGGAVLVFMQDAANNINIQISHLYCLQNTAQLSGGGGTDLFFIGNTFSSSIDIQSSMFANNYGEQGAGMSILFFSQVSDVSVQMNELSVINNSAMHDGGGLSVIFLDQMHNTNNTFIIVQNSIVTANAASGLGGGALFVLSPGSPLTSECAGCVQGAGDVSWFPPAAQTCSFPRDAKLCSQIPLVSTNYMQNFFVPYQQRVVLSLANISFSGNYVAGTGGALVIFNGQVHMTNTSFVSNQASQQAGGQYITGSTQILFSGNITFHNNTATSQTSSLLNCQGGVTIDKGATMTVTSSPPPGFSITQGQYDAATVLESGRILFNGDFHLYCPRGFSFQQNSSVNNVSVFVPGWPNAMLSVTSTATCVACGVGFYSMQRGFQFYHQNFEAYNTWFCHNCPNGADCNNGRDMILATKDYWGFLSSFDQTWSFTRCPLGYCCALPEGCSPLNSTQACEQGRDSSVPLCGACLPGYSQNLRGHGCSFDGDCVDGVWAWPALVALALVWSLLLLLLSGPNKRRRQTDNKRDTSWVIPTLLFFYQNVYFLFVVEGGLPAPVVGVISAVANLHLSGGDIGDDGNRVCVLKGMTTLGSIAIELVVPLLLLAMLGACYIGAKTTNNPGIMKRVASSAIKTVLVSYTTIASVVATLLHCVDVDLGQGNTAKVVFKVGAISCDHGSDLWWLNMLTIAFALIVVPFPVMLFALQVFLKRRDVIASSLKSIEQPYLPHRWYWPSVVLLRRLSVALVYVFIGDHAVQGISFSLLFVFFLVLQLFVSPHKNNNGNLVEAVGLVILVVTSLCALRSGSYYEANVLLNADAAVSWVNEKLNLMQTVLFFVPMVLTVAVLVWERIGVNAMRFTRILGRGTAWLRISYEGTELSSSLLQQQQQQQQNNSNDSSNGGDDDWEMEMRRQWDDERKEWEKERQERDRLQAENKAKIALLEDALRRREIKN